MSFYRILMLARRVIQQMLADRRSLILIFVVPLIVISLAGVLVRVKPGAMHVAVVMEDEGATLPTGGDLVLGQNLATSLGNLGEQMDIATMSMDKAQQKMKNGDLDAIIRLPQNFTANFMENRELHFDVQYEGSNPKVSILLENLLKHAADQAAASTVGVSGPLAGVSTSNRAGSVPTVQLNASYRYGGKEFDALDFLAPALIGLFAFMFIFILTSVSFLRERTAGTLERLVASPIRKVEIIVGYMLGFLLFALIQALIVLLYTVLGLHIHYNGNLLVVFVVEALLALMAVNLGIFASTFARNEFQVVQFIPLVVVSQIFLSGALWSIKDMPGWLQPIAWVMPLTHANYALRDVMIKNYSLIDIGGHVLVLLAYVVALIWIASQTIRRQVAG